VRLVFTANGWDNYLFWQDTRAMLRRVNRLVDASLRDPATGEGKPEPLRRELQGCWSRRIDHEHRLVYRVDGDDLVILQCRYHYER
jgi:toxin YoeB